MSGSGYIQLDGDSIRYRSTAYGDWDLALSDVRLIGECTNQSGPFADDYFFCFATGPGMWFEASFYADGIDEFLQAISAKLATSIDAGLCNSTDFASRVLWPLSLAGEPMFIYSPVPSGIVKRLLGMARVQHTYSPHVAAVLTGAG
jgi:hypothetical protein